jgi:long-chain acyl-CoA synthetase
MFIRRCKSLFLEDPKNVAKALEEVKPTMMCAVPRFSRKYMPEFLEKAEEGSSLKKKSLIGQKTGWETAELRRNERPIPFGLKLKESADMLVFSKIKKKWEEDLVFTLWWSLFIPGSYKIL